MMPGRPPMPTEAWRLHPADAAISAGRGWHCETRGCREPAVIVTQRDYTYHGRVRYIEYFVCDEHGAAFARRHHIEVDPVSEREARRLTEPEMAEFAADGAHCDAPACLRSATWIFLESYLRRGQREVLERLSCDRHAAGFAQQLHVELGPAPEGGDR